MQITELTTEQQAAVDGAINAVKNGGKLFRIGGYAGTGKTTVAKHIAAGLEKGMFCAFTGKAAYRLQEKGLEGATTIHRQIYDFDARSQRFHLVDNVAGDWFLIDEGSMLSHKLLADLNSFDKPLVVLGDPGQLEPIGDDPKLMHKPDIILQQIHRQAEGCGIVQFATNIRKNSHEESQIYPDVNVSYGRRPTYADLRWADIVICGRNKTRWKVNDMIRSMMGFTHELLYVGEQIIILKNNMDYGVFNGQIVTVREIADSNDPNITNTVCEADSGEELRLPLFNQQFGEKPMGQLAPPYNSAVLADYGYCITCHKSQGSEWDNVLVIDEQAPQLWNARRWRYTAITRAAKSLRYYF